MYHSALVRDPLLVMFQILPSRMSLFHRLTIIRILEWCFLMTLLGRSLLQDNICYLQNSPCCLSLSLCEKLCANKKSLYLSLIRYKLTYCSPVWRHHLIRDIVLIERVQRRTTNFILGCPLWIINHGSSHFISFPL